MELVDKRSKLDKNSQKGFISLHVLTTACHAVLNTQFVAPTPKPAWFDDLNAKLDFAKTVAGDWINNLAPNITSKIPLKVLNYAPIYTTASQQINDIATQFPDAQGADNPHVKQVQSIIGIMISEMDQILGDVDGTATKLKNWGIQIQKAHDDLSSGASSIQKTEASLQSDVKKMDNAIKGLNDMIDGENKAIALAAAAIGIGLLALIAGIALAPETGGASLLVAGTGALLIGGGAITWGVMQHKINGQFDEIAKDQAKLSDDQKQIVALKTLSSASNQSLTSLSNASSALSDFRVSWATFKGEMQGVHDKLMSGEQSLSTFSQNFFAQAAAKEWTDAVDFAKLLQATSFTKEEKTLPMDSNSYQAA